MTRTHWLSLALAVSGFVAYGHAQTTEQQTSASSPSTAATPQQGRSAGGDIGSGAGDIGKGTAKGAGNVAAGAGKGAVDVVTLHPVEGAEQVGTGAAKGGKNIAVGTAKGTGKIVKGTGRALKHIF